MKQFDSLEWDEPDNVLLLNPVIMRFLGPVWAKTRTRFFGIAEGMNGKQYKSSLRRSDM
jgi:hypothetical protein